MSTVCIPRIIIYIMRAEFAGQDPNRVFDVPLSAQKFCIHLCGQIVCIYPPRLRIFKLGRCHNLKGAAVDLDCMWLALPGGCYSFKFSASCRYLHSVAQGADGWRLTKEIDHRRTSCVCLCHDFDHHTFCQACDHSRARPLGGAFHHIYIGAVAVCVCV